MCGFMIVPEGLCFSLKAGLWSLLGGRFIPGRCGPVGSGFGIAVGTLIRGLGFAMSTRRDGLLFMSRTLLVKGISKSFTLSFHAFNYCNHCFAFIGVYKMRLLIAF